MIDSLCYKIQVKEYTDTIQSYPIFYYNHRGDTSDFILHHNDLDSKTF